MPHVIRLRGPWELCGAEATGPLRVEVPGDIGRALPADFQGPVRLLRRFNSPTNLAPDEAVYLVCAGLDPAATLLLNDVPLPCCPPPAGPSAAPAETDARRHSIAAELRLHNTLEIRLTLPCPALGGVHLEIGE